jgi:hypothetical protein
MLCSAADVSPEDALVIFGQVLHVVFDTEALDGGAPRALGESAGERGVGGHLRDPLAELFETAGRAEETVHPVLYRLGLPADLRTDDGDAAREGVQAGQRQVLRLRRVEQHVAEVQGPGQLLGAFQERERRDPQVGRRVLMRALAPVPHHQHFEGVRQAPGERLQVAE